MGSKKGDINKGRFSKENQPMKNETTPVKNAASRAMNETLFEQTTTPDQRAKNNKHIKKDILEYIGNAILEERKGKKAWIYDFIDRSLEFAKNEPRSNQALKFINILFREDLLDELQALYTSNQKRNIDIDIYKVRQTLYDKQKEVYDDNINKRILIINSRRSGKTELLGRLAVQELLQNSDAHIVYINRNSSSAIRQIRAPLTNVLKEVNNIKITKGSIENQEIHFDTGGQMLILGNNNSADIDKLRGERISLCILDECGHQRNMRQIIREVIGPALRDYGDKARLVVVGTPPRSPNTYVEEIYDNALERGWKVYHWTFRDNPFIPNRESVIEEVCKENGCDPNSAFIRREYFGEMGVYDEEAKWIKKYTHSPNENIGDVFDYAYVGVDWGYEDKAAVVSCVASKSRKQLIVVKDWSASHKGIQDITNEIISQINYLNENFNLSRKPFVICDNNEKGAVSDLFSVSHIKNVFTAYKYDKDYALDQLADMFASNKIWVKEGNAVLDDIENTLWARDEETDKIIHELDDDVHHPNALMALLYVSRQFAYEVLGWIDHNKKARDIVNRKYKDDSDYVYSIE